ncbi:TetR family transcriptional regulator [Aquisalinus flavus]|uniref:TetR family transcriptional regulator n=1 Tax=Aquisalinus flavus TaxID=1526572 RepID=A0A8J2V6U6_9PROT|nr:TetR/AcrR family transcriptional regulator [Aquisalinus flavus]MBD0428112.1 TetR/AcrR family transcriptional regulator [Aquisalinus flavus]GGD18568.1 TetR family transcriptional regulator [Aquisalinus flavus]
MGRPRGFETSDALSAITGVFWEKGYEGTSLQDIEAATGLNKQSLYRAFGDKRGMYTAALDGFADVLLANAGPALEAPGTVHERFARFYDFFIKAAASGNRRGCFLCNAATDQAQLDEAARASLQVALEKVLTVFARVIAGDAPELDERTIRQKAEAQLAFYFGLTVLIKAGMPEDTLTAVARQGVAMI